MSGIPGIQNTLYGAR